MANFQLNKYTFVSNGFGYAFKNFANFCHFNALNNNPAQTSDDVTKKTDKACSSKISIKHLKIRGRDITIHTWNTRTLRAAGKLQELTHEMDRYRSLDSVK